MDRALYQAAAGGPTPPGDKAPDRRGPPRCCVSELLGLLGTACQGAQSGVVW